MVQAGCRLDVLVNAGGVGAGPSGDCPADGCAAHLPCRPARTGVSCSFGCQFDPMPGRKHCEWRLRFVRSRRLHWGPDAHTKHVHREPRGWSGGRVPFSIASIAVLRAWRHVVHWGRSTRDSLPRGDCHVFHRDGAGDGGREHRGRSCRHCPHFPDECDAPHNCGAHRHRLVPCLLWIPRPPRVQFPLVHSRLRTEHLGGHLRRHRHRGVLGGWKRGSRVPLHAASPGSLRVQPLQIELLPVSDLLRIHRPLPVWTGNPSRTVFGVLWIKHNNCELESLPYLALHVRADESHHHGADCACDRGGVGVVERCLFYLHGLLDGLSDFRALSAPNHSTGVPGPDHADPNLVHSRRHANIAPNAGSDVATRDATTCECPSHHPKSDHRSTYDWPAHC
eukprot:m.86195 g.86195  ORF g.86195 m.86195 type:complete len:393 (-) comp19826_c0_seq2:835-2013(-)